MADTVKIAGVVLRNHEGDYLLVQEKQSSAYGLWNLPAGHVDEGETVQEAALRESFEETGFETKLTSDEPVLVDDKPEEHIEKYAFSGEVIGGVLIIPKDELLDARWFALSAVKSLHEAGELRSPWVINAILRVENNENSGH